MSVKINLTRSDILPGEILLNARSTEPARVPLKNPSLAALLAWLLPGLGHLYQGRRGKGILYMVCILGLFFAGLWLGAGKNVFMRWTNPATDSEHFRPSYFCQLFVGLPAFPGLIQATLTHYGHDPILWGYLAEPAANDLNASFSLLGSKSEIGWLYTVIAGLLNVLAIYDALEGPADAEEDEAEDASASQNPPQTTGSGSPEPAAAETQR